MEQSFEREVLDRLKTIEVKLDGYSQMKAKTYDNERDIIAIKGDIDEFEKRVSSLEESNKWLSRSIAGAVITAIAGVVVVLIRMGAGI
jgi:hypothetical protein